MSETIPGIGTHFAPRADLQHIPMCRPTETYKPINYQWAYDAWLRQKQIQWIADELDYGYDVLNYGAFPDPERALINNILRLFTQSDINVQNSYQTMFLPVFQDGSVGRMLYTFGDMELVHIDAYSKVLETVGLPDEHYTSYLDIAEMRAKHDMMRNCSMETPHDIATTLAKVSAFGEGLQLFSSFAMLLNFPRFGKMKSMGQIVSWSARDETLHVWGMTKLFHQFCCEAGIAKADLKEPILETLHETVMLEDAFIDRIHELGPIRGYTLDEMKAYIRYVGDFRLQQLGYDPVFHIASHPMPWLEEQMNLNEHANFFETRSTEYSKATMTGEWANSWDRFENVLKKLETVH